ncbi:MAG TPA: hypothetical protein VNU92_09725 [Edaphobacter sp.]|nr:hypothetical protein [Edaphobacter sp.]
MVKTSTGIAGKDSSWNSESGQRLRIASPTAYLPQRLEVALVALAGGSSPDESRRAAAALRLPTAMLTK